MWHPTSNASAISAARTSVASSRVKLAWSPTLAPSIPARSLPRSTSHRANRSFSARPLSLTSAPSRSETSKQTFARSPTSASAAAGAGDDAGTGPDGADAPAATVAADEPGSGGDGAWLVLRARGRARAGRDVDLARQAAAAAARTNLAKLLKKKGLLEPGDPHLDGAVIERYFRRGRYLYAVAAISVAKSEPADLNVPRPAASKSTGAEGKTSRNPGNHGGEQ